MKMKLLISAMMVMFFSLVMTNNVSAQMRRGGGPFRYVRTHRLFVPPVPRVSIAVRPPLPVVAYGCDDYPVYRRPVPRYYGEEYYGGGYYNAPGYYRNGYENSRRGYYREGYDRRDERRDGRERNEHYGPRNDSRRY